MGEERIGMLLAIGGFIAVAFNTLIRDWPSGPNSERWLINVAAGSMMILGILM